MVAGLFIVYAIFIYVCTVCAIAFDAENLWKRARAKRGSNGATVARLLLEFLLIPILLPTELSIDFYKWCKK